MENEKNNIIEKSNKKEKEEKETSLSQISELNNKIKILEEEKQKALNENNNKENEINEKNKNIEEIKKDLSIKETTIESLNKIVSEIEEKKKEKIPLIFELDKNLMGENAPKRQFLVKDQRNKRFIQIVSKLFKKYPVLHHLNVKHFINKSTSEKIDYYENAKGNNLSDNSTVIMVLE